MRQWRDDDLYDFWLLNSDSEVMEFLPEIPSEEDSNALANKIIHLIEENGWGFWAVETISDNSFIGFVGLNKPNYKLPVNPCIEIGWRLARKFWGNGYATEAGNASLEFAFNNLNVNEIYSFTSVCNKKSEAVMKRLNMVNANSNFNHPTIPDNSPYREHVLYKIDKKNWFKYYA